MEVHAIIGLIIETADDWWNTATEHQAELVNIMERFLPMNGFEDNNGKILPHKLREHISIMFKDNDRVLPRYLNAAWGAAPDHPSIHTIPAWSILCDLCSEEGVLFE